MITFSKVCLQLLNASHPDNWSANLLVSHLFCCLNLIEPKPYPQGTGKLDSFLPLFLLNTYL